MVRITSVNFSEILWQMVQQYWKIRLNMNMFQLHICEHYIFAWMWENQLVITVPSGSYFVLCVTWDTMTLIHDSFHSWCFPSFTPKLKHLPPGQIQLRLQSIYWGLNLIQYQLPVDCLWCLWWQSLTTIGWKSCIDLFRFAPEIKGFKVIQSAFSSNLVGSY